MKFSFDISALDRELDGALKALGERFDFGIDGGTKLSWVKSDEKKLTVDGDLSALVITAPDKPAFFRGIGLFIADSNGERFRAEEEIKFDMNGLMFDLSRNSVITVERTKDFLLQFAILGLNTYLMYMEDTYEIKEVPMFGYMRGRYSREELKEIDDFAYMLGIEVIPCIQTLAHINQFLRWENWNRDIDDILLVGSDRTKYLIDKMFAAFAACLRTRRIHVGMDEAYHLGRGRYLDANGYRTKGEIMHRHLEYVSEVADKYGFKAMMWDDMFFWNSGGQANLAEQKPANIIPVYWDYYRMNPQEYRDNIAKRLEASPEVVFAGGAWRWAGFAPRHSTTVAATKAALTACIEMGVREVFTTAWGDDGSEAPADACMLGTVMFAEFGYGHTADETTYEHRLEFVSGMDYDCWFRQDDFDSFAMGEWKHRTLNPHYYTLFSDILCGIYDWHLERLIELGAKENYAELERFFTEKAPLQNEYNAVTLRMYAALAKTLKYKCDVSLNMMKAYRDGDKAAMKRIIDEQLKPLGEALEEFRVAQRAKWLIDNKHNGFEIIDMRIGGLEARVETAVSLASRWVDGDEAADEELACLAEERLKCSNDDVLRTDSYVRIFSAAVQGHGINV